LIHNKDQKEPRHHNRKYMTMISAEHEIRARISIMRRVF